MSLKAVHYINQFYAGIGGETMADTGFGILEEKKGPALGLEQLWNGEMTISKVVYCGDNYVNTDENYGEVKEKLAKVIREEKPDVFIAGPAFNAGRYGVACAKVCDYVRSELGVPSVTCMWHENPAIDMYVENNYIVPSTETAVGMRKTLPALAKLALKLARKEKIGTAHAEGYLPTGHRYNEYSDKSGAERVVDMLVARLYNKKFETEVPLRSFEVIPPAAKIKDISKATIALFTTGGLVPVGNPADTILPPPAPILIVWYLLMLFSIARRKAKLEIYTSSSVLPAVSAQTSAAARRWARSGQICLRMPRWMLAC